MLFIAAFFITCIVSMIFSYFTFDYVNPATGKQIAITNMLSPASLVTLMTKMVTNYSGFPPLGMVIVATLGIGIADGSGYINTGLKKILTVTPKFLLTPIVIVVGMLSHLAPDSGYMIIIPIAAYLFYASGKHPLSGVAASFAGIAGAFAANYTPSVSTWSSRALQMAAQIIDPTYEVNVLCNYFYAVGSTFAVIGSCWWITEKVGTVVLESLPPRYGHRRIGKCHDGYYPKENPRFLYRFFRPRRHACRPLPEPHACRLDLA